MFRAAIFAISCIIFLFWSMYALRNSFKIVVKGLQCCYHIWLFHLLFLIFEYAYHGLRPIWKSEPAGYIYGNSIACIIHGKVTACFAVLPSFLATLFSLSKARIYFEVHNRYFWRLFSSSVWAGLLPCIGYILTVQTGQTHRDGHPNCMKETDASSALLMIYLFHWLSLNNFLMYHTIFGHITYLKREEEIQHGLELVRNHSLRDEDNQNIQIGLEMDEFTLGVYWVDLPGIHPIQLTHEIVNQFNIWDCVVDDAYIQTLQQSRHLRYDSGCFGHICKCPHEFLTLLDRHEESNVRRLQRSHLEDQRGRRAPSRQDQAENSSGIHRLSVEVVSNIPTQNTLIE